MSDSSAANLTGFANFVSDSWARQIELLEHLIHFSQSILVVQGQTKSGKTTFLKCLSTKQVKTIHKIYLYANHDNPQSVLTQLNAALSTTFSNLEEFSKYLQEDLLKNYAKQNTSLAFIIDDAHKLNAADLVQIINLIKTDLDPRRQCHLVLAGSYDLGTKLSSLDLGAKANTQTDLFHMMDLENLDYNEFKSYVKHKYPDYTITESDLVAMYQLSSGNYGKINEQLTNYFKDPSKYGSKMFNFKNKLLRFCFNPVLIGIFAGVMVGSSFLFLTGIEDEELLLDPINMAQFNEPDSGFLELEEFEDVKQPVKPIKFVEAKPQDEVNLALFPEEDEIFFDGDNLGLTNIDVISSESKAKDSEPVSSTSRKAEQVSANTSESTSIAETNQINEAKDINLALAKQD